MLKEKLEAIWRDGPLNCAGHVALWSFSSAKTPSVKPGTPRNPPNGDAAQKFMARVRAEYGPPPPAPYSPSQPLRMGKEKREWLRKTCPRNYETLVKLYGRTVD